MEPETATAMGQRLREWRQAHPQATCDEIEEEGQREWAPVPGQLVAELAQHGAGEPLPQDARPQCPDCQRPLQARGRRRRRVATRQAQVVTLERADDVCPACGAGVSPLDEALGLGGGSRCSPKGLQSEGAAVAGAPGGHAAF